MKTEIKNLTVKEIDDAGHGLAKIATLTAVDHDGDTYQAGAFGWKEGGDQWVPILPAHDRKAMPLGKARVYEHGDEALADFHLNLNSAAGREWHSALKFDLEKGNAVGEWSYGYDVLDALDEQRMQKRVRVIKRVDVHEVSPVIRGAGIGTGTLSIKSRGSFAAQLDDVIEEIDDIIDRAGDVKALREADGRPLSKARLDQLAALKSRLDALVAGSVQPAASDPTADELAAAFMTLDARRIFGR